MWYVFMSERGVVKDVVSSIETWCPLLVSHTVEIAVYQLIMDFHQCAGICY